MSEQDWIAPKFDAQGDGYDYASAVANGLGPDETGHWPSRVPETGLILKGAGHETYSKTVEGERAVGNVILPGEDGRLYSKSAAGLYPLDYERQARELTPANPGLSPKLGASFVGSLDANPDEIGRNQDLARRTGWPVPVVEADPERAAREASLREADLPSLMGRAPGTATFLEDPRNAQLAHDDVANLSTIERYLRDIGQRGSRGLRTLRMGNVGSQLLGQALAGQIYDPVLEFRLRQIQAEEAKAVDYGVDPGGAAGFLLGVPGAVAEMGPMAVAGGVSAVEGAGVGAVGGAIAGLPEGPAGVLGFGAEGAATGAFLGMYLSAAKMEGGNAFVSLRDVKDETGQQISPRTAAVLASGVGVVAGAFEQWGLERIFKNIPALKRLTGDAMTESAERMVKNPTTRRWLDALTATALTAGTEGFTEGIQELVAISGELAGQNLKGLVEGPLAGLASGNLIAPKSPSVDGFTYEVKDPQTGSATVLRGTDAILARVLESVVGGAQGGGGMTAAGHAASAVADSERAQRAVERAKSLLGLKTTIDESKVLARNREAFKRAAKEMAEASGTTTAYVEPEAMRTYFESIDEETANEIMAEIPELRDQDEEVARTGAEYAIPMASFLSRPDMVEALHESVRFDLGEMNAKEALGHLDDLERNVGDITELAGQARDERTARTAIAEEMRAQLSKAYPETVVAPLVDLMIQRYETRAQRLGVPLAQFVADEGLFQVQGPNDAQPERTGKLPASLEEKLRSMVEERDLRRILGDLRASRIFKPKKGTPIIDYLRVNGGVRGDSVLAGELRSMGFVGNGKGSFAGLFPKKPRKSKAGVELPPLGDIDNLVADQFPDLAAVVGVDSESGYLSRQGLLDELRNELRGESRVMTEEDAQRKALAHDEQRTVRDTLDALGLSLDNSDEEIVQAAKVALPDEYQQPEKQGAKAIENPMVLHHNLTAENLAHADRLGGLPMPSLAISSAAHPMSGYGEITLIGDEAMAKPGSKNPVYPADAYSPEYPKVVTQLKESDRKKINAAFNEMMGADWWTVRDQDKNVYLEAGSFDRLADDGEDVFLNTTSVRARFLFERGQLPEIAGKAQAWRSKVDSIAESERADFDKWKAGFFDRLGVEPKRMIFLGFTDSGNRRYQAETAENVLVYMKRELRSQDERTVRSATEFRARVSLRFRSIREVKAARGQLKATNDVQLSFDQMTERAVEIASELSAYLKHPSDNQFIRIDQALDELSMVAQGKHRWGDWFDEVPQDLRDRAMRFTNEIRSMPTEYFEAKPQRVVNLSEFKRAVVPQGDDASAEILERHGVEVIRYSGDDDRTKKIGQADREFFQEYQEAHRGAIRMTDDLDQVVIRFTEAADLSTFLHESGHLFLAQLEKDARSDEGQIDADLETVKEWAREQVGTDDIHSEAVQELWARSIEAYYFEGKAPSLALDRAFARFTSWLVRIYKRLLGIPGYKNQLTPEIRGVMDRLLATDAQIAEMQQASAFLAPSAEDLGMTEEQAAKYQARVQGAIDEARRKLQLRLMNELEREKSRDWENLKAEVRKEVQAEVNARPVFRAKQWLSTGKALDGQPVPIVEHQKLAIDVLVEMYGREIKDVLPRAVWQAKGGYHPDAVAELFGFSNGDDLVRSLEAAGDRRDTIERETEARMVQRHGRLQTRDELEAAAVEEMTSDKQMQVLQEAERDVATKAGGKVIPLPLMRKRAELIVRRTRYRDQNPAKYRSAAAKAGRAALKLIASGDFPAAQLELRKQQMNLLMESYARKAMKESEKAIDYFSRVQSARSWARIGKAGEDYQDQIEGLLERFDLSHKSLRRVDRIRGFAAWIAQQEAGGQPVNITDELRNEAFKKSWKELTLEEIESLRDAVKAIEHLARKKNEFTLNKEKRETAEVRSELIAAVEENLGERKPLPQAVADKHGDRGSLKLKTADAIEQVRAGILSFESALIKVEFLVDLLDGGRPDGPWRKAVFTPMAEAQVARYDLSKEYTQKFAQLMEILVKGQRSAFSTRWYSREFGGVTSKWNILSLALNVGNEGNYARLTSEKGNRLSPQTIDRLLVQHMTKADWEFVQATWDLIDSLWPRISELEQKVNGVKPERVQTREVVTPFGTFRGGYFPIVYDQSHSLFAAQNASKEVYETLENNFARAITGHGYTKERQNVAGPLLLDMAVVPGHLDKVIHDLTHREAVTQVDRLLNSPAIREAFKRAGQDQWFGIFKPWLQSIASDRIVDNRALGWFARLLRWTRTNVTTFTLGLRTTTLASQLSGHSNAIGILSRKLPNHLHWMQVGRRKALAGLRPGEMQKTYDWVLENSGEMRHRINNIDRDMRDVVRRNQGKLDASSKAKVGAMGLIGKMQMFGVDLPVWIGSYEGAVSELGMSHKEAVLFADSIVRMSQGGAGAKDLAVIQRADEGYQQFLMFFSYRNLVYNQTMLYAGRRVKAPRDVGKFLASWALFVSLPLIYTAMLRELHGHSAFPGDEDDDLAGWISWLAKNNFGELIGMIPLVDMVSPIFRAAKGKGRYMVSETPAQRLAETMQDLVVPQDDVEFMFDALRFGALVKGLPADQMLQLAEKEARGK